MAERVLVAGATGTLGSETVRELKQRGYRVRALGRDPRRLERLRGIADELAIADAISSASLAPVLADVDRVVSCMGASVIPTLRHDGAPFTRVDTPANRRLIEAAQRAGVRRFVYVSVFSGGKLLHNDFVRGHEEVVEMLRSSGIEYAVARPTAFFSSIVRIMRQPSWGLLPETGGGLARTNPIHEADLAAFCSDLLEAEEPRLERDVGGPDVFTRREIAAIVLGPGRTSRRPVRVPVNALRLASLVGRPFNPRVSYLMDFIAGILSTDFVAPCYGTRRLADFVAEPPRGQVRSGALPDASLRSA